MLNIIAVQSDDIMNGILAAMTTMSEVNVAIWNPKKKPVNDMLVEAKPDYLFLPEIKDSYIFNILIQERVPIIQYGNHRNLLNNKLLCTSRPVTRGVPHLVVQKRANIAQYFNGKYDPKLACDIAYISNFDTSNRPHILYCIQSLINAGIDIKIAGKYSLPFPQYLGILTNQETANLMRSATTTLDFDNDISYDIWTNLGYPINQSNILNAKNLIKHEEIKFMLQSIKNYKNQHEAQQAILANYTYHHQVAQIFTMLNMPGMSQHAINTLEKYLV